MPRLTKQLIDETPFPAAGRMFVRDTELRGFALRVTQGRKSFILEKRIRGRMRRLTLGPMVVSTHTVHSFCCKNIREGVV